MTQMPTKVYIYIYSCILYLWHYKVLLIWGRFHRDASSQLITVKSQIFQFKNSNLHYSDLVGFCRQIFSRQNQTILKSSVFTFKMLSVFQSFFFRRAYLQTSQKPRYTPYYDYFSSGSALCTKSNQTQYSAKLTATCPGT